MSVETFVGKLVARIREVSSFSVEGTNVRIVVDFSGIQLPWVLRQMQSIAEIVKNRFPGTGVMIDALNENYIGRFPLDTVEAKLGSGVVSTVPIFR